MVKDLRAFVDRPAGSMSTHTGQIGFGLVWIDFPYEGLGIVGVVFFDEAVDCERPGVLP